MSSITSRVPARSNPARAAADPHRVSLEEHRRVHRRHLDDDLPAFDAADRDASRRLHDRDARERGHVVDVARRPRAASRRHRATGLPTSAGSATDAPLTRNMPGPHHWESSLAGWPVWTKPNAPAGPKSGGGRARQSGGKVMVNGRSKFAPRVVVSNVVAVAVVGVGDATAAVGEVVAVAVGRGVAIAAAAVGGCGRRPGARRRAASGRDERRGQRRRGRAQGRSGAWESPAWCPLWAGGQ